MPVVVALITNFGSDYTVAAERFGTFFFWHPAQSRSYYTLPTANYGTMERFGSLVSSTGLSVMVGILIVFMFSITN